MEKLPHRISTQQYDIRRLRSQDFETRYWDISNVPVFDAEGNITSIIHNVEDVTERRLLQQAAAEAKRHDAEVSKTMDHIIEERKAADQVAVLLQAIIDTAQAGIFLFTPIYDESGSIIDFRFRVANRMLAAYVGQTAETVTGSLGSLWFPGYKTNGLFDRYSHTAITGATNRFEFHYDQDGIDVWLDIMSTKVGGDVLVTFTDHTSLKQLQRRLEGHVEELRSSNANLEQFAYVASHDLQEPLRKIKSFGDMLQNRYGVLLGKEGGDLIARMQSAASRMSALIEDLLTYSRMSVKPGILQVLDVDKILDGVLFDLERVVQNQKAIITRDKLAPIAGQATQIGQLFQNLISNALKFHQTSRRPEIQITSRIVKGGETGMSINPIDVGRTFQLIKIKDNGIGFDNAYRDRIFQIFQRLHNRSEFPGTGVGLSIVKKVVENHNGYIEANSTPGEGATFSILLPAV
jgi:signal transduction histidine kinase